MLCISQDPLPAEPWEGVRNGSVRPPECMQVPFGALLLSMFTKPHNLPGSEDCLYLNIHTSAVSPGEIGLQKLKTERKKQSCPIGHDWQDYQNTKSV